MRYWLAQRLERTAPWLVLRYLGKGPTGLDIYRNILGGYEVAK